MRRVVIGAILLCAAGLLAACGADEIRGAVTAPDETAAATSDPAAAGSTADDAPDDAPRPTTVSGTALPQFEQPEGDPALGREPPVVVGTDLLTGDAVQIASQGRPMVVAFYAHWCPHCQAEVAALTDWLESNELPAGVDFYAVSVFEDATRGNHPPQRWLSDEGWRHPVVADTPTMSVADAFGLQSVPYLVAVNADNEVVLRFAGNVQPADLAAYFESLVEESLAETGA